MNADNLMHKNLRIETAKVLFEQQSHPLFSLVQSYLLGIPKISGSMPIRFQLLYNRSEQKTTLGIYLPHFFESWNNK